MGVPRRGVANKLCACCVLPPSGVLVGCLCLTGAWAHGNKKVATPLTQPLQPMRPKAFYMPWEELPRWAQLHVAEYGKAKILALAGAP